MTEPVKPEFLDIDKVDKNFSELIEGVARGQSIVIMRDSHPVAKLSPYTSENSKNRSTRNPGGAEGFKVPESFFEPLPDDFVKHFE